MPDPVEEKEIVISFEVVGTGWASVSLSDYTQGKGVSLRASYLTDTLGQMASSAIKLLEGEKTASFLVEDEPGTTWITLARTSGGRVSLSIQDGDASEPAYETELSLRGYAKAVLCALRGAYGKDQGERYNRRWKRHRFPEQEMGRLEALVEALPAENDPSSKATPPTDQSFGANVAEEPGTMARVQDPSTAAGRLCAVTAGAVEVAPPYATLAIVDVVSQAARVRLLGLERDAPWGMGFGWADIVAGTRNRGDKNLLRLVKRMRSDSHRVERGKTEALLRLHRDAATFLEAVGAADDPFVPELPTRTETVNSLAVETPTGFRTFDLVFGYPSISESDVVVTSTHTDESKPLRGPFFEALESAYGIRIDPDRHLLRCDPTIWTLWQPVDPPAPFRSVLVLRMEAPRLQSDPVEYYDRALRTVFASLAALEHMGHAFPTIGIPTLAKKRIQAYEDAVAAIIENSSRWLRVSRHTHTVRFFVTQAAALRLWNNAMNRRLGRSLDGKLESAALAAMCEELHPLLSRNREGPLAAAAVPLAGAVSKPESLVLDNVSVFGRKLVELVAEQVLADLSIKRSGNLLDNIEKLREAGRIAPWVCSYMHALRILGNRGVHSSMEGPAFVPPRPGSVDLVAALVAARALLGFWEEWRTTAGP